MENNKTLLIGASGATGKQLVSQLLLLGQKVTVIVRPGAKIPDAWTSNDNINIIRAENSTMSETEMAGYIKNCHLLNG